MRKSKLRRAIALPLAAALLAVGAAACAGDASQTAQSSQNGQFGPQAMQSGQTQTDPESLYQSLSWPQIQLPAQAQSVASDGQLIDLAEGSATITQAGVYHITGTLTDGQLTVAASKDSVVTLILDNVTLTNPSGPALCIESAELCMISLVGDNVLTDGEYDVSEEPDGCLYSKDDLLLTGEGSLTVNANSRYGIVCKDNLYITGGSYTVSSVSDAIRGVDSLTVTGGDFVINAGEDGLKTSQDSDESKGWMLIEGGTFTITAGDDAVHAETLLRITGGQLTIPSCNEGLEGQGISLEGGTVTLTSADDGINAASTSTQTCLLAILGGEYHITAGGDGVDSNGCIWQTGGEVIVSAPNTGANGALDYDSVYLVEGGTMLATGGSGMAQGSSSESSQPGLLVNLSESFSAGSELTLQDADGNVVFTAAPDQDFNSVFLTCPQLTEGESYTLLCGESELATLTLEGGLTQSGTGGMMGMGGGGRGGRRFEQDASAEGEATRPAREQPEGEPPEMPEGEIPEGEPPELPEGEAPEGDPPAIPESDSAS